MLFKVENMSCQHCVNTVTRALQALDPDARIVVDLGNGQVRASGSFTADAAISALADEDYPARLIASDVAGT